MIFKVRWSTSTASFFGNLLKATAFSQTRNFVVSVRYCVIYEKQLIAESSKLLPSSTISSTQRILKYFFSSNEKALDKITFESVCAETLDSLSEYFEELVETIPNLKNADVIYSDGVLTVNLGKSYGTYVINRQTPNLQIWLSSPTSGPKRYDFIEGTWVYKHDKTTLHSLLDKEIKEIVDQQVQFVEKCLYSKAAIQRSDSS